MAEDINKTEHPKPKKVKLPLIIIAIIFILAAIVAILLLSQNKQVDMTDDTLITSFNYELSSKADFYTYGSNIYYATNGGMQLVNAKGDNQWTDSYTMISPVLIGDKNIAAVAEDKGNTVRLYNEGGLLYNVSFNEQILTFAINSMGYLGTINKNGSDYSLSIYDNTGAVVFGASFPAEDGIPTCMDISDDGKMFSVGFINTGSINIESNILFYYINSSDVQSVENSDGMFASVVSEDCIPVMLRFTADNRCIAVTDDRALFIDPTADDANRTIEIPLGNRLRAVCINEDCTLTMAMGEQILNAENQLAENTVVWYNSNGSKINEYLPEKEITALFPGSNNITVIAMDRNFEAFTTKGESIWTYTAIQDTSKVLPFNGNSEMLVVTPMRAMLAKVGKGNSLIEIESVTTDNKTEETTAQTQTKADTETTSEIQSETQSENQTETTSEASTETTTEQTTGSEQAE